jgi:DNA-binding beta-propeller fold protein YncE
MDRTRKMVLGGSLVAAVAAVWLAQSVLIAGAGDGTQVPRYEVDPLWPKPLPNHWLLGSSIGVWVDDDDIVWMIHRSSATLADNERGLELNPPTSACCAGAPPVLAFDQEGNLVHSWGGPGAGYDWPTSNHGIFIDHLGFVWIGGNGEGDSHVLKFTKEGQFVAQFGRPNARATGAPDSLGNATMVRNSNDMESFGRVAKIFVDEVANEVYLADGYFNKRVAVIDPQSGAIKRYWGAYGNRPDDSYVFPERGPNSPPAQQFRGPVHCADVSVDRLVYVCDRQSNRIQVFTTEGEYVTETFIAPNTLGSGSTWDIAFSRDPEQRYIFLADGVNMKVHILDRQTLRELANFGDGGRQPGTFYGVHSIATDSRGNIYTTETYEGKRIQRFINTGMVAVTETEMGVPWPE